MIPYTNPDPASEQTIQSLSRIRLSDTARARMRTELSAYADMHAVTTAAPVSRVRSSFMWVRTRSLYASALALVLIIATGTQATLASEKAIPGDALYGVKVAVAEPVAFALAATPERKAVLAADFATRRIDEAAALQVRGKLDERTADALAARFDAHVSAAVLEVEEMEADGDVTGSRTVQMQLEEKIVRHVAVFAEIAGTTEEPTAEPDTVSIAVADIPTDPMPAARGIMTLEQETVPSALMATQPVASSVPTPGAAMKEATKPIHSVSHAFSLRVQEKARMLARVREEVQVVTDSPTTSVTAGGSATGTVVAMPSSSEPVLVESGSDMTGGITATGTAVDVDASAATGITTDTEVVAPIGTTTASTTATSTSTTTASTTTSTSDQVSTPSVGTSVQQVSKEKILPVLRKIVPFITP